MRAIVSTVYDDVAVERHRWARLISEEHLVKPAGKRCAAERDGFQRLNSQ